MDERDRTARGPALGIVRDPDPKFAGALALVAFQLGMDADSLIAYAAVLRARRVR